MSLINIAPENKLKRSAIKLLQSDGYSSDTDMLELDLEDLIIRRFEQLGADSFIKEFPKIKFSYIAPHKYAVCLNHVGDQIAREYIVKTKVFVALGKENGILDENKTKNICTSKIKPELELGNSIFGGTYLTNSGHVVSFIEVNEEGVIINDPYGAVLNGKSVYLKNGADISNKLSLTENNLEIIERRFKYHSSMLSNIKKLIDKESGNWPVNIGERNFYTWEEVTKCTIGKWISLLETKQ